MLFAMRKLGLARLIELRLRGLASWCILKSQRQSASGNKGEAKSWEGRGSGQVLFQM